MDEWRAARLGELVRVGSGSRPDQRDGPVPVLGANGATGHTSRSNLRRGYVVGRVGAAGAITKVDTPSWASDNALTVEPLDPLDHEFVGHLLRFIDLTRAITQTAQPLVTQTSLAKIDLLLPPASERRRIAEILDTIDLSIQATTSIIAKLWATRIALIEQELARVERSAKLLPILDVVRLPTGQIDPRVKPYRAMLLVGPEHVEGMGRGRLIRQETAADQGAISGKYFFLKGDVIYSKIRPELRKAWIASQPGICSADMYPLRPTDRLTSEYLGLVVLGERFSKFAAAVSGRSSGMPKINRSELSEFPIPVPDISTQVEIANVAASFDHRIETEAKALACAAATRIGLATDLLTGRVRTVAP